MTSRLKVKRPRAARTSRPPKENRGKGDFGRPSLPAPIADQLASGALQANRPIPLWRLAFGAVWLVIAVWSYWPLMLELVTTWLREPDYSHGFLVMPLALVFLWIRRQSFPGFVDSSPLLGSMLLSISIAFRFAAARYYMSFLDGWSIIPLVAGATAIFGGRPLLWWSLPSVCFLIFMVPLPFRLEGELSAPLQRVATKLSTVILQVLGQPAFSEGNVIVLGDDRLEVAQACSGLRLFVSTLALTYVYLAIIKRAWWERVILALGAIPIAIFSNAIRIVVTGLVYQTTRNVAVRHIVHDSAGWGMIVMTAVLFALLLWYLSKLTREEVIMDVSAIIRRCEIG